MDGGEFFRQAVQELYDSPFASRKGPRISAGKAAKLARRAREAKKQEALAAGMTPEDASKAVPAEASQEKEETSPPGRFVDHFVMNLPATAIDLLGCFDGIYTPFLQRSDEEREAFLQELKEHSKRKSKGERDGQLRLPMVHCYCFTKELEAYEPDICKVSLLLRVTHSEHALNTKP